MELLNSQIFSGYCIVNNTLMSLTDIEKMGINEFSYRAKRNMPVKLFKYFPDKSTAMNDGRNVNYSMQALMNNTVYMQAPNLFDDVYDSNINLNFIEYHRYRLIEYCRRTGITINPDWEIEEIGFAFSKGLMELYEKHNNFEHIFEQKNASEMERLSNQVFINRLIIELSKGADISKAVANTIESEYREYTQELQNSFRVSCFTTTPFSQLMWGSYADCHRGFCIEYTILPDCSKYTNIYNNLFPLVYCKTRPRITEQLITWQDKERTEAGLWNIYFHGALRKSIDWLYQNEWRLLLPPGMIMDNYEVEFFPITHVYLGNRMDRKRRESIINYCNAQNIPYDGVVCNPDMFEMQLCDIKCESCKRYTE